ncbi:ankyrin repeat-containing domain protein [Tribonema minus]|uniref:Ankyrin repeat-containing domain protein n=1 Tax=Tribonema minus TaxID=303371 RepID=A0A835ZGL3_9STRA|nr:ankyrin repeat-containing domain protein [Tribonema minus]
MIGTAAAPLGLLLLSFMDVGRAFLTAPGAHNLPTSTFACCSRGLRRSPFTRFVTVEGNVDGPSIPAPDANTNPVDIFDAILEGDAESVARYIAHGGDVNIRDSIGDSPLMLAAENDFTDIIKLLVHEGGADINGKAGAGMETPLILAAYYGYTGLCVFLVEMCGADMEVRSGRGDTALNVACHWGNVDTAQYLLDRGADPNCANHDGKRAGDEFETVFVDGRDEEAIREALEKARAAWPTRAAKA